MLSKSTRQCVLKQSSQYVRRFPIGFAHTRQADCGLRFGCSLPFSLAAHDLPQNFGLVVSVEQDRQSIRCSWEKGERVTTSALHADIGGFESHVSHHITRMKEPTCQRHL